MSEESEVPEDQLSAEQVNATWPWLGGCLEAGCYIPLGCIGPACIAFVALLTIWMK